jgi:hypothetical protein
VLHCWASSRAPTNIAQSAETTSETTLSRRAHLFSPPQKSRARVADAYEKQKDGDRPANFSSPDAEVDRGFERIQKGENDGRIDARQDIDPVFTEHNRNVPAKVHERYSKWKPRAETNRL